MDLCERHALGVRFGLYGLSFGILSWGASPRVPKVRLLMEEVRASGTGRLRPSTFWWFLTP